MKAKKVTLNMRNPDYEVASQLIIFLTSQEECIDFLMPVDPDKLGIPSYKKIIKNPMDMKTIQMKLKKMKYESISQVLDDIQLIWENCRIFNMNGSDIVLRADIMDKKCKKYCIQNSILPIKRLRPNKRNDSKATNETCRKKCKIQNTKSKKLSRVCDKNENDLNDEKGVPENFKASAKPLKNTKNTKNPEVLKEKPMSQPIIKQIPTENCESIDTEDYYSEELNLSESSYEHTKYNKTANNIQFPNIGRNRQIELKKAISTTNKKKFDKIMQVLRLRAPNALEITRTSLEISLQKLIPRTFDEIWKITFDQ